MEENDTLQEYQNFLKSLSKQGKHYVHFRESIKILESVASTKGLDDDTINKIFDILTSVDLNSTHYIALIKCTIPQNVIDDDQAKRIITWFLSISIPATALSTLLQWIIGCWEYQLINRNSIYIFYDAFFYIMLKHEKLESRLAQLVYLMTKPEDVTRRQVTRLLKLNEHYKKPQKHIIALLSLFKSYKPEFVPERIPAINIQSVWRPIVETLRVGFESARDRVILKENQETNTYYSWNTNTFKYKKNQEPLVPFIRYFNIGSNIFKDKTERMVFDVTDAVELGKFYSTIQLPTNTTSLLANKIGHHLLTFADFEYQQRFIHNLYYTLWKSFIFENGRYFNEEMNKIIDMTIEFFRYMQHGISIVNYFINEYLSCYIEEYNLKLLSLMQWSSVSIPELQDYVFKHMKIMFYSSSINTKCRIIKTLRTLLLNLSVINNNSFKDRRFPFLGQSFGERCTENVKIIEHFTRELIMSGLNIHFYNSKIISEALLFYEQIAILEIYIDTSFIALAPSPVIYGSFVNRSCSMLSRVCALLLQYRKNFTKRNDQTSLTNIKWLIIYAEDLASALWYDNCFSNRLADNRYFLKYLSKSVAQSNPTCDVDSLMNICQHYAVMPYLHTLNLTGLHIKTKTDANIVAAHYYNNINKFIVALSGN
ncbi:PREDICTED: centromere protein I-like [Ceratosolen solmsi marchali]|uniref:Centromere protein I-like n=1 Tax=Ceratosolen solmsi marchali TaxID=326594 RepID=A0AAJ7E2C9_9HYME|nr:PREDICTED: centromere protein I-like [Ceratosolen solmsi marchali]